MPQQPSNYEMQQNWSNAISYTRTSLPIRRPPSQVVWSNSPSIQPRPFENTFCRRKCAAGGPFLILSPC